MGCNQPVPYGQCLHQDLKGRSTFTVLERSQSTGCKKEQHCTACAIHTFPRTSSLSVPQWAGSGL